MFTHTVKMQYVPEGYYRERGFEYHGFAEDKFGKVVSIDFIEYGEVHDVPVKAARHLIQDHADKFKIIDGELPEEEVPEEFKQEEKAVRLRFKYSSKRAHLTEYHGIVDFLEYGEEKDVPTAVADYLLEQHGDSFEIVYVPQTQESDLKSRILTVLDKEPIPLSEVAERMAIDNWRELVFPLSQMIEDGLIDKEEDKTSNRNLYYINSQNESEEEDET